MSPDKWLRIGLGIIRRHVIWTHSVYASFGITLDLALQTLIFSKTKYRESLW